jgi:DNA adenine methylase
MTAEYRYKMAIEDYERLVSMLAGIKGKFILTINDHEAMRDLFSGYRIEEAEVGYSIGKEAKSRGRYGELMIRNYG